MAKNWMAKFDELDGFVSEIKDPYAEGIRSSSPSVNFIFGNTHLIPRGAAVIFWGPPKGGKSLICNDIIGRLHQDDPEALVFKFDTEFREKYQMTERAIKMWGIDPERYRCRSTNKPEEIFDFIEKDIVDLCQKGAPIKLIVIDSVTDIMGRRAMNATSVSTQQIGDEAATLTTGLKRIKSVIKNYGITLLMVCQERAELDQLEQMRGKKTKMAGSFYLKHAAEFFVYVAPNESKEGKTTLLGEKFENAAMTDVMDNPDTVAHRIKLQMKASSVGLAKRVGEFTFDRYRGLINIHEEVFRLGIARNVLEQPNNRSYILKDWPETGQESKWTSKEDMLINIKQNEDLGKEIIKRVKMKDIELYQNGAPDQPFVAADSNLEENETEESDA